MRPHSLGGVTISRIKLVLACGFSLATGVALVWSFAPRAFRPLSTLELGLILGLMALPLATILAWAADRRNPVRVVTVNPTVPAPQAEASTGRATQAPKHLPRVQTHGPAPRHQRVEHQAHEHA